MATDSFVVNKHSALSSKSFAIILWKASVGRGDYDLSTGARNPAATCLSVTTGHRAGVCPFLPCLLVRVFAEVPRAWKPRIRSGTQQVIFRVFLNAEPGWKQGLNSVIWVVPVNIQTRYSSSGLSLARPCLLACVWRSPVSAELEGERRMAGESTKQQGHAKKWPLFTELQDGRFPNEIKLENYIFGFVFF